jgi:hypothetical protein
VSTSSDGLLCYNFPIVKKLGRTCLLWSLLYLLIAGGLAALVYERYPELRIALGAGAIGGLFVWIALSNIAGVKTQGTEADQVRRAIAGGTPPDGERVAVAGTISAKGDILESPVTRTRCAAYEYKAVPPGHEQVGAWQGVALVPTSIEGSSGSVRILAVPELEFEGLLVGSHEHRRNFREYVENTRFAENTGMNFKLEIAHQRALNENASGRIRDDVHNLSHTDPDNVTLIEKVLLPGDRVVAFGKYSRLQGGLVPDDGEIGRSIRIVKGEPEAVLKSVSRKRPRYAFWGCGCTIPVLIAAVIGIAMVPLDAIEGLYPQKDPSWTEVRVERAVRERLAKAGLLPDVGRTPVELSAGTARGKLTWHGVTTHFGRAIATRRDHAVEITLGAADHRIDLRIREDRTLEWIDIGQSMLPANDVELELQEMSDESVRGRITYLTPKNDPSLRIAFHARFEE